MSLVHLYKTSYLYIHMKNEMGTTREKKKNVNDLNDYCVLCYLLESSHSLNYNRIINIISSFDEHAHKPKYVVDVISHSAQGSKG